MGAGVRIGSFTDEEAGARFLTLYERALAQWPDPREERDIETRFGRTRVHGHGRGEGIPVVLIHGQNATSAVWASNVAAIAAHRPVLAVDMVGEAGHSAQTGEIRTAEAMAAWLDEVLDGLGEERVHLVGHSYGGWAALNQAVRAPERIVSVTAADPPRALTPLRAGFLLGALASAVSGSQGFTTRWLGRVTGDTGESAETAERQLGLSVEALRSFRVRLLPPQRLSDEELRSVKVPVQILLGADSRVGKARSAEARARLLPDVRAEVVPGAGHAMPVEVMNSRISAFVHEVEGRADAG